MIASGLRELYFVTLIFSLFASGSVSSKVVECSDSPQKSPNQPELVQHPERPIDLEISPEQRFRYDARHKQLETSALYHDIVLHPEGTLRESAIQGRYVNLTVDGPVFLVGLEKPQAHVPQHVCKKTCGGRDFATNTFPV